jgi:hypothetical protein
MHVWTTRLISLAVYAALWTAWIAALPDLLHIKSTVKIESELPQSEVLRRLSNAGIDAKEIKISKWGRFGSVMTFVSVFLYFAFLLGTFLGVHTVVKAAIAKWAAPADERLSTPGKDDGDG